MVLTLALFAQIASACAVNDAVTTLVSVAELESGLNTLAIHDNSDSVRYSPESLDQAERIAAELITVKHHSVDLGIMQINTQNLQRLGLSIPTAFDACHSIAGGAQVLREGFQRALRGAFSLYNTGDLQKGVRNGYAARVEAEASALPAIHGGVPEALPVPEEDVQQVAPCAPAWDVWAVATCGDEPATRKERGNPSSGGVTSVSLNQ